MCLPHTTHACAIPPAKDTRDRGRAPLRCKCSREDSNFQDRGRTPIVYPLAYEGKEKEAHKCAGEFFIFCGSSKKSEYVSTQVIAMFLTSLEK